MQLSINKTNLPKSVQAAVVCSLISLIGFLGSRYFEETTLLESNIPPVATKVLKFEDQQDGGVRVIDFTNNQTIHVINGEAGFVRGVLRTVARERKMRGKGPEDPIILTAYKDGRIVLKDPITDTKIEIESFGKTNAEAFNVLLFQDKNKSAS
jgi:putative photosynthetic complex assembly protein